MGNYATYKGGGYVLVLGRTVNESIGKIESLKVIFL